MGQKKFLNLLKKIVNALASLTKGGRGNFSNPEESIAIALNEAT